MVWRKLTGKRDPLPMLDMPVLPGGPSSAGSPPAGSPTGPTSASAVSDTRQPAGDDD